MKNLKQTFQALLICFLLLTNCKALKSYTSFVRANSECNVDMDQSGSCAVVANLIEEELGYEPDQAWTQTWDFSLPTTGTYLLVDTDGNSTAIQSGEITLRYSVVANPDLQYSIVGTATSGTDAGCSFLISNTPTPGLLDCPNSDMDIWEPCDSRRDLSPEGIIDKNCECTSFQTSCGMIGLLFEETCQSPGYFTQKWNIALPANTLWDVRKLPNGPTLYGFSGGNLILDYTPGDQYYFAVHTGATSFPPYPIDLTLCEQFIPNTPPANCAEESPIRINVTAALEGPMQSSGIMSTFAASNGLVPLAHPFAGTPYNYAGTESVLAVPTDVVDWVLLELRDANDANSVIETRACFIKSNGSIVDMDGTSGVSFSAPAGDYYVSVNHKSHLGVVSNAPVSFFHGATLDLTSSLSSVLGADQLVVAGLEAALKVGDYDGNNTINFLDFLDWFDKNNFLNAYQSADSNLDGTINFLDFLQWFDNNNSLGVPEMN